MHFVIALIAMYYLSFDLIQDISKVHSKELEKVWVNIYDNSLSENQTLRLAANHNLGNVGSMTTPWVSRVHACREWLYKQARKNINVDETPASTQAWRQECQLMYVPSGKVNATIERTNERI